MTTWYVYDYRIRRLVPFTTLIAARKAAMEWYAKDIGIVVYKSKSERIYRDVYEAGTNLRIAGIISRNPNGRCVWHPAKEGGYGRDVPIRKDGRPYDSRVGRYRAWHPDPRSRPTTSSTP